ncbi:MAG: glycosyltransferase [Bacteroidales bacterium]|nr:glycosyltransferase [Bacteroidales bacterium]
MSLLTLSPIALICLTAFGFIVFVLLLYYLVFFGRFVFRKEKKHIPTDDLPPISVIIVARDESHHLIDTLPALLTQEYPTFEVVLVNDKSRDETPQIAIEMKNRYQHLHYVNMVSAISNIEGKKFPLAIGIQAAQYDTVLLTDASAIPSSPYWLRQMGAHFVRKTSVVLGHTSYESSKGLMNQILHYDALATSIQAFAYAIAKMPVMADGRNLAYSKSLFFKNKQKFFAHARLPFGEDNIFINEVVKRDACDVAGSPEAVISQQKIPFSKWFWFKKCNRLSFSFYKFTPRFLLFTYNWMSFLFYVAAAVCLTLLIPTCNWLAIGLAAAAILLKIGIQYLVFAKGAKKLAETHAVPLLFLHDLFFVLLQPWIFIASKFERLKWI